MENLFAITLDTLGKDDLGMALIHVTRLARKLDDLVSFIYFQYQNQCTKEGLDRLIKDYASMLDDSAKEDVRLLVFERWANSREVNFIDGSVVTKKLIMHKANDLQKEIDTTTGRLSDINNRILSLSGMNTDAEEHYIEVRMKLRSYLECTNEVRSRIKHDIASYVVKHESAETSQPANLLTQAQSVVDSYFETSSSLVYDKLSQSKKVTTAVGEECAHMLTTVRRALEAAADHFFPPIIGMTKCRDGKERDLSKERYVSRLIEYISRNQDSDTVNKIAQSQLGLISSLVDKLNGLASKGVHSNVTREDAELGFVMLYALLLTCIRIRPKKNIDDILTNAPTS